MKNNELPSIDKQNLPHHTDQRAIPAGREQRATRTMFFLTGFATAVWAALVPFAKLNSQINDGTLGLLLLCLGGGALLAMPIAGALTTHYGCRVLLVAATILFCIMMPLLAILPQVVLLAMALLIFGIGIGTTDCVMNIQAILVEKAADRPMMSGFHGLYSVGGIAGALAMSMMMSLHLSPLLATIIASLLILLSVTINYRGLLSYANPAEGPAFARPKGAVLILGMICFILFLAEGTVLDWSAVFLIEYRDMPSIQGGLGFAFFSTTMMLGRLTGDKIISKFGAPRIVFLGIGVAIMGFLVVTLLPYWLGTLVGYALIGLGCANIVPIMFSAIGRQPSMPQAIAVPAVTTMGYAGVLAGPASIGFIAQHSSLPIAFLLVTGLLMSVIFLLRLIKI